MGSAVKDDFCTKSFDAAMKRLRKANRYAKQIAHGGWGEKAQAEYLAEYEPALKALYRANCRVEQIAYGEFGEKIQEQMLSYWPEVVKWFEDNREVCQGELLDGKVLKRFKW